MNHKNRVERSLRHQPTDKIPRGELCIDDTLVAAFLGIDAVNFSSRLEFIDRLDLDLICLPTRYGDDHPFHRMPDPRDVSWEDADSWQKKTDRFVFALLDGGFSWGVKLLGFEKFLVAISRRSPEVMELFGAAEQLNGELSRMATDKGIGGVVIADDIAHRGGPMVDPARLREHFFPSLARQTQIAQRHGHPVFFHSDGDLRAILPDIVRCGIDGLQCIEAAAGMDLSEVKKDYGGRLCLWGNLDPVCLTAPVEEDEIETRVRMVLESGGTGGGFIFGTSSGLFQGMLRQNIEKAYGSLSRLSELVP
ncbi:MAG: uroporphyrinogen decarboxylase family protein [Pseudomonadota bacterium]